MREIRSVRDGWAEIEMIETGLLRQMSVQESVAEWVGLQRAFEAQLQETAPFFAAERRAGLAELQSRLQRLVDWQARDGQSV